MKPRSILTQDEAAYVAGYMSGNLRNRARCPYPFDTVQSWSWSSGRIEGEAQPKGTLPQLRPIKKAAP